MVSRTTALKFIIFLGVISLFADFASDGARSVIGPYLATLGASAAIIGFVAGFGELVSYGLRIVSGYIVELTGNYWMVALLGYMTTMIAVPALALARHWEFAAMLLVLERMGKALRTPARDTMLSHASQKLGRGWSFGLHKMLDQIGAMAGPILVTFILYFHSSYKLSFVVLLIPAALAIVTLLIARSFYPHPNELESETCPPERANKISPIFWVYIAGSALVAAGYTDFPLIAYHFQQAPFIPNIWIPLMYAIAIGVSGITALIFGSLFDRNGYIVLILVVLVSAFAAPLVFLDGFHWAILGMVLWGVGIGSQISLMRAIIANMIPMKRRGSAYGIFNAGFGVFWFLGSALMGLLYSISLVDLVIFSVLIQLAALPLFIIVKRKHA